MCKYLLFLQHRDISHSIQDQSRSVWELIYSFSCGYTGKYKNCVKACLNTGDHIGIHTVTDHNRFIGMYSENAKSGTHHQRIGFADVVCLFACSSFDRCYKCTAGRCDPAFDRACDICVGCDQLGSLVYQVHGT